ncbi:hypothetical protein KBTX_02307 [wastewater metagenome]|uniref:PPM-type phosphatase domain-containing protein n=2 Tax=unclassified sequences TaxID=12908 RepID=A0A5B8RDE8_9ZZZZ|nr:MULTISPECIES: hypothetical protein [Arhodomonas]QEA05978.1 hypothetical protein KBTEX_02307 [uncultured organism]
MQLSFALTQLDGYVDSRQAPPMMPPGRELAWFTLRGLAVGERAENQDNLVVVDAAGFGVCLRGGAPTTINRDDWPAGRLRIAVLDGMGGHDNGRQVAEDAADAIRRLPVYASREALVNGLDALHDQLHADWGAGVRSPGCTLTLLEVVAEDTAWLYHVGDSRLYELGSGVGPRYLTLDHAPSTRAMLAGAIDVEAWQRRIHRQPESRISQAFAMGNTFEDERGRLSPGLRHLTAEDLPLSLAERADCRTITLRPGGRYLLSTDGLWAVSDPASLVDRHWKKLAGDARQPDALLRGLLDVLQQAAQPGESDNTTALLLQVAPSKGQG